MPCEGETDGQRRDADDVQGKVGTQSAIARATVLSTEKPPQCDTGDEVGGGKRGCFHQTFIEVRALRIGQTCDKRLALNLRRREGKKKRADRRRKGRPRGKTLHNRRAANMKHDLATGLRRCKGTHTEAMRHLDGNKTWNRQWGMAFCVALWQGIADGTTNSATSMTRTGQPQQGR
ncbi:hypothetical protein ERJ75_001846700 [Trypanosoma vivax]|nr:hypothetical protein ERJ75_001846700 [Trypanosoma vivax]